jgi:hypothetical protein
MRIRSSGLVIAAVFFACVGVSLESVGSAADAPNKVAGKVAVTPKQAAKQAIKKKLQAEAKAKKAAEAEKAAQEQRRAEQRAAAPAVFQPVTLPKLAKLPEAHNPQALAARIDQQILAKLAEESIIPSPRCSDEEFLRRVYLDLTGVIPTAEQARQFLDSTHPNKRAELIDELLASPNYGRHLADLWLPKLFPSESNNRFVQKGPFYNWLKDQFNANVRWDQLVFSLVTATGTVKDNPAVTYFLANRSIDKLTDTATQHFLGIQLQCAQCHNHPFTGWKQKEYWGMAAFFSKVNVDRPRNTNKGGDNSEIGVREGTGKTKARDFFPEAAMDVKAKFLGGAEPTLNSFDPYRPVLARWMVSPDNPYFAKAMVNRTWGQLFGRGFVNPIDDMHPDNPASHPQLLEELANAFAGSGFDLKYLTKAICLSETYQRSSKTTGGNENDDVYFSHRTLKVFSPEQLYDSLSLILDASPSSNSARGKAKGAGAGRNANSAREQFIQFYLAGAEQANPTAYDAGIPQALRLMNSRFGGNGAVAQGIIGQTSSVDAALDNLLLATLSRRPTPTERQRWQGLIAENGAVAYADLLWAILNSSEFSMIR